MSDALDRVLAGPFLRYTTDTESLIWLATSGPLEHKDCRVVVWDPAPTSGPILYDYNPPNYIAGASSDTQSVQITTRLYAHVIRVKFSRRLKPKKVYAYRLELRQGAGDSWLGVDTPGGTLKRLEDRRPKPPGAKDFASFVLPDPRQWWQWGLPSQAFETVAAAGKTLRDEILKRAPARPSAADLQPLPAPTSLFFFGTPFTFSDPMPTAVQQAIFTLAEKLMGLGPVMSPDEWPRSVYASAYLLAWSPSLWQKELAASLDLPRGMTDCVDMTAMLMANTPSYLLATGTALPTFMAQKTGGSGIGGVVAGALARVAHVYVNAIFADWPNTPQSASQGLSVSDLVRAFAGSAAPLAKSFVVPGFPSVGCVAAGDSVNVLLDPKAIPDRIASLVSAAPVLRAPDGTNRAAPAAASQHDVTLLLTFTSGRAFMAESGDPRGDDPTATYGTSSEGTLHGKVFEVAASVGSDVDALPSDPNVSVVVQREAPSVRYASMRRSNNTMSLSIEPRAPSEQPIEVLLPEHGRVYAVKSHHEGLHLGNRFWTKSWKPELAQGDRSIEFLRGVQVAMYAEGARTPVAPPSTADADGWVALNLVGVDDGPYNLRIEGPETSDHAGPDTPVTNSSGAFKDRVWLRQSFPVDIVDAQIVAIDHEPVPSRSFRLLIDPVWMHASARATDRRGTGRQVKLIVLHRTDSGGMDAGDAAGEATAWQHSSPGKKGAHYLLARDGTLLKCADESESIGHAGFDHLTSWRGRNAVNSFSIGVEISKQETWDPYTEKQYAALLVFLRRFRTTSRPDVEVTPMDIVGHSDFRLQEAKGTHPIRLGDRNDPGLAFDWTRLERVFLGMRRDLPEAPSLFSERIEPPADLVTDRDTFNAKNLAHRRRDGSRYRGLHQRVEPGLTWGREIKDAIARFDSHYTGTAPSVVAEDVRRDLETIGYYVTASALPAEVLSAAVQAFRSHFFSGPRRTYFSTKVDRPGSSETWASINPYVWSTEEEQAFELMTAEGKLTVTWVHEIAEYLTAARRRANPSDALYDGQRGWKQAADAEAAELRAGGTPSAP